MLSRVEKFEEHYQTECIQAPVNQLEKYIPSGISQREQRRVQFSKTRRMILTDARYTLIAKGKVQGRILLKRETHL